MSFSFILQSYLIRLAEQTPKLKTAGVNSVATACIATRPIVTHSSAIVITVIPEITRVTAGAIGRVLQLIRISYFSRPIRSMAVNARCFTSSVISWIITACIVCVAGFGGTAVVAMVESTLVCPCRGSVAGVALYPGTSHKMPLRRLRSRAATGDVTIQTTPPGTGIMNPRGA